MKTLGEIKVVMRCKRHGKVNPFLAAYSGPNNFLCYICEECTHEGRFTAIVLGLAERIKVCPIFDGKDPTIWKTTKGPLSWIKYDFGAKGRKIKHYKMPPYPNTTFNIEGVRLFDPRTGKLTEPGDGNPALFLRDLFVRAGIKIDKSKDKWIKELADYCDQEEIFASMVIDTEKGRKKNGWKGHPVDILKDFGISLSEETEKELRDICDEEVEMKEINKYEKACREFLKGCSCASPDKQEECPECLKAFHDHLRKLGKDEEK